LDWPDIQRQTEIYASKGTEMQTNPKQIPRLGYEASTEDLHLTVRGKDWVGPNKQNAIAGLLLNEHKVLLGIKIQFERLVHSKLEGIASFTGLIWLPLSCVA